MIGLVRRRYMGSKSNILPASSYIQNGLIALYDGIENAGAGIHDANATSWLNLANTSESITGIDNTFTWGDDYLLPAANSSSGVIPPYSPVTTEAVIKIIGTNFVIAVAFNNNGWIALRANNTLNFYSSGYYAEVQRGEKMSVCCNGANTTTPDHIYINGVDSIVKTSGGYMNNWVHNRFSLRQQYGNGTAYFYCIRLYNRALTEQEVLANYNIDKIRFGLT